ncbi:unnamed protein product [Sphagnum tenellum]
MESPSVGRMRSSHSWPHDMRKGQGKKPVLSSFHELWTDGLLCAYEFIPGAKKRHRVGGKLGEHTGHNNQVKFDAELHAHEPQSLSQLGPLGSDEPSMRSLEAEPHGNEQHNELEGEKRSLASKSGDNQGELKVTNESVSGRWSLPDGRNLQHPRKKEAGTHWVPISWDRLTELVATVQVDAEWLSDDQRSEDDGTLSVANLVTPYLQSRSGPTWWCHVDAHHPYVLSWLANAQWLHPAISAALCDESRLISDRMKYLFYEVPIRVGGGLLFELLGHSVGDPQHQEEDVPVVLRAWHANNFLVTSMHVKGYVSHLNVLGVMEVQDLVSAGGSEAPDSAHAVIAQLANRLARWDDRLFRKHYFGASDEVELKFVSRKEKEDLTLLCIILNQEIRRLSNQVIRVKWALHAREEILYELMTHLKEREPQRILERVRQSTRDMLDEQEAVRTRIFTVQDVMQSNVRAVLQDTSIRTQHNLAIIGGGGLLVSIIVGLFGINVDGIPGNTNAPYAFMEFSVWLLVLGAVVSGVGILFLGMKSPPSEEEVTSRKVELQELVKTFQRAAEANEKVRDSYSFHSSRDEEAINPNLT